MPTNTKEMYARWYLHSKERAMDRYGVDFSPDLLREVVSAVRSSTAEELSKISGTTRVVYRVFLAEQPMTLVYCSKHSKVITFLHNSWVVGSPIEPSKLYIKASSHVHNKAGRSNSISKGGKLKNKEGKFRKQRAPRLPASIPQVVLDEF